MYGCQLRKRKNIWLIILEESYINVNIYVRCCKLSGGGGLGGGV